MPSTVAEPMVDVQGDTRWMDMVRFNNPKVLEIPGWNIGLAIKVFFINDKQSGDLHTTIKTSITKPL